MIHSRARWLLVVIVVLLWVIAIYPAYYVVHTPLNATNLHATLNVATDLLTWLAILAVATALGSRLTRRLNYHSLLERITFSAGVGLGIFSLLVLGLSLAGILYGWLLWLLLAVAGLLSWPEFRTLGSLLRRASYPRARRPWHRFLIAFIAATLLLALLLTLLPPIEWDGLTYHLVGPQQYLQAHRFTHDFDVYYLFFPEFTEMLFTLGMGLKSDVVARLLHLGYLFLTLGALGAFAKRFWKGRIGLVAAALFVSIPTAVQIATWAYVDMALTFYTFVALYALFNWLESMGSVPGREPAANPARGWLILAGLFGGISASIKYTGVTTLLILGAVLLWTVLRRRLHARDLARALIVISGIALVVASPWYLKNTIVTGNPIYPLVWGGQGWNQISTRWLLVLGQKKSLLDLILVPWTLSIVGKEGTLAYDATFSPLFLLLLPLLLLVRRRGNKIGLLLLAAAVGYLAWIGSGAASYGTFVLQGRMLLPIFAPLSLLCAYSLDGLAIWDVESFSLQRVMMLLVGLTLTFGLLNQALSFTTFDPLSYLSGYTSRDRFQDQYTSQKWHLAITYVNENLTPDDRVLFIWEPRSYGVQIPHEPDVLFDNFSQLLDRYGSVSGIVQGLRDEGFTHVLVNQYIYPWIASDYPITPEEKAAWEDLAKYLSEVPPVYTDGEYLWLYQLGDAPLDL